jgi:hypothetical protein
MKRFLLPLLLVVSGLVRRGIDISREVAEAALAHVAGDRTERAYRRGDALEKRRALMEAWAAYCEPKAGNVVSIVRRTAKVRRAGSRRETT